MNSITTQPRLTPAQVDHYRTEGCFIYDQPVLPETKFTALKDCFEGIHGPEPNTSSLRRCAWTLRFCSSAVKFNHEAFHGMHQVCLARGRDRGGNVYADATRAYPEMLEKRGFSSRYKNSH